MMEVGIDRADDLFRGVKSLPRVLPPLRLLLLRLLLLLQQLPVWFVGA